MKRRKIIAILHGIPDEEILDVAETLVSSGITLLEVSMSGANPLRKIQTMVQHFGEQAVIGAGMVVQKDQPYEIANLGGRFIFSPYTDSGVIKETLDLGMYSFPSCFSPTECFEATAQGTHTIGLFPVNVLGATGVEAIRGILPEDTQLYAVGGVTNSNMAIYHKAGCVGFGIKSYLYQPGYTTDIVAQKATKVVKTYDVLESMAG
ncbi:MAG: 2-dehydro-3-deoxy-6-phosphogalactonate aldolase [Proteobacteria bacterium]|nr:MAG: 2-dehydro-3-deoxy-6-phosphogalactonate aldolase [Pseudomonadota bacterium]